MPQHALLAAALLLLLCLAAAPCRAAPALPLVSRQATYDDIPGAYRALYSTAASCPSAVGFGPARVDARNVALLPLAATTDDDVPCAGPADIALVSKATVVKPGLLADLDLDGFRAALDANPNALNLVNNDNDEGVFNNMLVGWHPTSRVCGGREYAPTTIYFVIKEETDFTLRFENSSSPSSVSDTVTVPAGLKALFIVATDGVNCLLVDTSTAPAATPSVTSTDADGDTTTTFPLTTATSDTPPTQQPAEPTPTAAVAAATAPPAPPSESVSPAPPEPTPDDAPPEASDPPAASPAPSAPATPVTAAEDDAAPAASDEASGLPQGADGADDDEPGFTPDVQLGNDDGDVDNDDDSACFPAASLVLLPGGASKPLAALRVGDVVADGRGGATPVVLFTHRARGTHPFLRLRTLAGHALHVSPGHYVYANGGALRAAASLAVGDALDLPGDVSSPIVAVHPVAREGLYNPQTAAGALVVDGVRVSAYTTAVHPRLAHAVLMAPVRWLYRASVPAATWLAAALDSGSPRLAQALPGGPQMVPGGV